MLLSEITNIQLINENADTQVQFRCLFDFNELNIEEEYDALKVKLMRALNEHWKNNDTECWDGQIEFLIRAIPDLSSTVFSRLAQQVKTIVEKILLDFNRQIKSSHFEIQCGGIPSHPLTWSGDLFLYCEEHQSVSDINKFILQCDTLYLNQAENIEGGVLRLLQLSKTKHLKINSDGVLPWAEIVEKHFASDRDVIDCQQELIDAGLKTFARF